MGALGSILCGIRDVFGHDAAAAFAVKSAGLGEYLEEDGGPGSGNFGHKGRPGKRGGSGKGGGKSFRTESKSSSSGYVGIQKAKAWKGIANVARSHKGDFNGWKSGLDSNQRASLRSQYSGVNTKETFEEYSKRIFGLLSEHKVPPRKTNKPVNGESIIDTYRYDGPKSNKKGSADIDTEIEDVLHKQGFDGVPKVVSQKEFDEIVRNNPQMPILLRTYTAPNPEVLQDYDDMLESGFWYVDCGVGGAQYGQGMYCAGCYSYDLYGLNDLPDISYGASFKDSKGRAYEILDMTDKDEVDAGLMVGKPYLWVGENGERKLIWMNYDTDYYEDISTGERLDDSILESAKEVHNVIRREKFDASRDENVRNAISEMNSYAALGLRRAHEKYQSGEKYIIPDGMKGVSSKGENGMFYYDPNEKKPFGEQMPEVGQRFVECLHTSAGKDMVTNQIWEMREDGKIHRSDGTVVDPQDKESFSEYWSEDDSWIPVKGKCEEKPFEACCSTRMMTLDPSAKIISYDELRDISSGSLMYADEQEIANRVRSENKGNPDVENLVVKALTEAINNRQKYESIRNMDLGALAAALGYDAINAEGHGDSGSYTVVLNRTKVILSDERVDI